MNIITVIPLTRSKVAEELSYFTASDVPLGAVVSVPLRSKSIHAIVTDVKPAEDQKSSIKRAAFVIRKLGRVRTTMFFPPQFIEVARLLADYYATTIGSVIYSLVSNDILENAHKLSAPQESAPGQAKKEVYAVQGDDLDRIGSWRSLIRQEFARKKSVSFYAPTVEEAKNLFNELEKGIEGYIFELHNGLTTKKMLDTWQKIAETEHPVVIIATAQFCLLPRGDIDTVIMERENNREWISQRMPYVDTRFALEQLATKRGQSVYIADVILRAETLYRLAEHSISEGSPFKWRSISTAHDTLVDMRKPRTASTSVPGDGPVPKSEFRVLSSQLENLIRDNQLDNTHMFIYNVRRGSSPTTVCDDCESVVVCRQCSSPVVLHTSKDNGRNFFMCHKCGERRSADENCVYCGSWRLTPLGIGIDRVAEEIKRKFPDVPVFQIDADSTNTDKLVLDSLAKWKAHPGSILLGTEMSLPYLPYRIEHAAVASMDSLFALPDFRMQEKIMHALTRLRSRATRTMMVQTRLPTEKVFDYGLKGNLSDFYRATIEERATAKYPPHSVLIKITIEGKKDAIAEKMASVQNDIGGYEIDVFPAFTSTVRGNSVIHGLIKLEAHAWPDPDLVVRLRSLPPNVSVKVNPESLL